MLRIELFLLELFPIPAVLDRKLDKLRHGLRVFVVSALDPPGVCEDDEVLVFF